MADYSGLVEATSNRLRLLQTQLADSGEEERRGYLASVLQEALESVLPEHRDGFLAELEARFPTWDIRAEPAAPQPSSALPREMDDWTFLLEHLLRVAARLDVTERKRLIARLAENGLAPPQPSGAWSTQAERSLKRRLELRESDRLVPDHVVKVAELSIDLFRKLESTLWITWREIAPQSTIRRGAEIKQTARDFVTGSEETTHTDVQLAFDQLRRLACGLAVAIGLFGQKVAQKYVDELSPDAVRAACQSGKWYESEFQRWWKKYEDLAWGPDRDAIERELRRIVAKNTEDVIHSLK